MERRPLARHHGWHHMSTEASSSRWPVGIALFATALGAALVFQVTPEGREARAVLAHGTLFVAAIVSGVVVSRNNRSADGWQSGRALATGLLLTALGTGGLVVWDIVGEPRLGASIWDL